MIPGKNHHFGKFTSKHSRYLDKLTAVQDKQTALSSLEKGNNPVLGHRRHQSSAASQDWPVQIQTQAQQHDNAKQQTRCPEQLPSTELQIS